ncbi:DNA-dependent ATPase fun30 [Marasmius tenuissimus]|uniref:DNA-dependent ATPase fun30 n=1 Tax=Marasmius tenuissimus TaxID=585030 RepID=A0ABR3AEU0_9AGAR
MASSQDAEKKANRAAALNDLKARRANQANQFSTSSLASSKPNPPSYREPPPQSRDGTTSSRFFPTTPSSSNIGNILVPSSSPLTSPQNQGHYRPITLIHLADVALNAGHGQSSSSSLWGLEQRSPGYDPSTAPSGFFRSNGTRPPVSRSSVVLGTPLNQSSLKRPNGALSPPTSEILDSPASPAIQRPGKRRKFTNGSGSFDAASTSSDESLPETAVGPSRPRIVKAESANKADPTSDQRFVKFKITQPLEPLDRVKAAWLQADGDSGKASQLLLDPQWSPNPTPRKPPPTAEERGKVEAVVVARERQRLAAREKGKKSMIYANRIDLSPADTPMQPQAQKETAPSARSSHNAVIDLTESPAVARPKKRIKKMVLESESEVEVESSEDDGPRKKSKQENPAEIQALKFFNTKGPEALQELTGCTLEQAETIIAQRPFHSVDDLNERLAQGKKKAGPAGISPRMFEDSVDIINGYDIVDNVLADCENIGAKLRSSISSWTSTSSSGDEVEDGALSLRNLSSLKEKKRQGYMDQQPSLLSKEVTLKDYQLMGVNWLHLLYKSNLSCILADEMGLGKTIQVISFFAWLKQHGNKGPHLVVVPSSTLENWCREFARFAPSVSVQTYYAGKEERIHLRQTLLDTQRAQRDDGKGWDVLVTTYNLAQGDGDRKFFRRIEWDCCVFDEGHVLKNFQSQRYQALLRMESKWRLLLTGTPLQNNLQELVSLMNFILPDQFAEALGELRAIFKVKGDSKVSLLAQERVSRAKKMMTPFVLRRRKDQVLSDLPKKSERIQWCEGTQLQKSIYRNTLQRSRKTIIEAAEAADTDPTTGKGKATAPKKTRNAKAKDKGKDKQYAENSANVLMDLRKAALHPMLFRSRFTDDKLTAIAKQLMKEPEYQKRGAVYDYVREDMTVMTDAELQYLCGLYKSTRKFLQPQDCFLDSGKVQALLELLKTYGEQERRVLIFSQFTQVLDILEVIFKQREINYLVLTGSTPVDVRQSLVDEFTEDTSISAFLLSTKAGGMGINLTAASVVIMFDQDFNPHNDRQAQDRAYRIGQKRDVDVVKLITKGTIEEDILKLGEMKLALDEAVAGDDENENGKGKKEGETEKVVKTSLMKSLRAQLMHDEDGGGGDHEKASKETESTTE